MTLSLRTRLLRSVVLIFALLLTLGCRHKALEQNMVELEERVALLESAVKQQTEAINQLGELHAPGLKETESKPGDGGGEGAESPEPSTAEPAAEATTEAVASTAEAEPTTASTESSVESEPSGAPEVLQPIAEETKAPEPSKDAFPTAAQEEVKHSANSPVATPTGTPEAPAQEAPAEPPPINVQAIYDSAYQAYCVGQLALARTGFNAVLTNQPGHALAPNAAYWLGEVSYDEKAFEKAQAEFQSVLDRFPKADKASAALLKVGKCQERLGKVDEALATFRRVIELYPESAAAKTAKTWF